jgi:hypothetical protein
MARLVSPDGEVTIDLDERSVDAPAQLAYAALAPSEIPALPAKFKATGKAFELTSESPLLKPITITVALSTANAALAAGNTDNIIIQHHTVGAWTPLATAVDFQASTATAKVDSLSLFALTVLEPELDPTASTPAQIALPTSAPPAPTLVPTVSTPKVRPHGRPPARR